MTDEEKDVVRRLIESAEALQLEAHGAGLNYTASGIDEAIQAARELESSGSHDELLRRAADKLQDYMSETDGEHNDPLAMEIYRVLGD